MQQQPKKTIVKIILLGDSNVGKTSLIQQFTKKRVISQYKPTIGPDFCIKEVQVDNQLVVLHIWDTAGQERFNSLGVSFFRGADCCVFVYDISINKSFDNLENWKQEFLTQASPKNPDKFPFFVIGNKKDKVNERKITSTKAIQWCKSHNNMDFIETDAKEYTNVEEAFLRIARQALKNESVNEVYKSDTINLNEPQQGNKDKSCFSCS